MRTRTASRYRQDKDGPVPDPVIGPVRTRDRLDDPGDIVIVCQDREEAPREEPRAVQETGDQLLGIPRFAELVHAHGEKFFLAFLDPRRVRDEPAPAQDLHRGEPGHAGRDEGFLGGAGLLHPDNRHDFFHRSSPSQARGSLRDGVDLIDRADKDLAVAECAFLPGLCDRQDHRDDLVLCPRPG